MSSSAASSRARKNIGEVLAELRPDFPGISIPKIRFLEDKGLIRPDFNPAEIARSWLLVPGTRPETFGSASASHADQIVLDIVNSPIGRALNLPSLVANVQVQLSPGMPPNDPAPTTRPGSASPCGWTTGGRPKPPAPARNAASSRPPPAPCWTRSGTSHDRHRHRARTGA